MVEVDLSPAPIPADWVLRGKPEAAPRALAQPSTAPMVTSAWMHGRRLRMAVRL